MKNKKRKITVNYKKLSYVSFFFSFENRQYKKAKRLKMNKIKMKILKLIKT